MSSRFAEQAPAANPLDDVPIGTQLSGRYRLEAVIGTGAHGIVYEALDQREDRRVVVKISRVAERYDRGHLRREVERLQRIDHPRVVMYLDAGRIDDGRVFLVCARVEGVSVARLAEQGPIRAANAIALGAAASSALGAVHCAGILHRDVKPSNLIVPSGSHGPRYDQAVLIDFGVSRSLRERGPKGELRTLPGDHSGTVLFMAPEQAAGWPCTESSDLYGLGATLFTVLYGHAPMAERDEAIRFALPHYGLDISFTVVPGRLTQEVVLPDSPRLPDAFAHLLLRMLKRDTRSREHDAQAVYTECVRIQNSIAQHLSRGLSAWDMQ